MKGFVRLLVRGVKQTEFRCGRVDIGPTPVELAKNWHIVDQPYTQARVRILTETPVKTKMIKLLPLIAAEVWQVLGEKFTERTLAANAQGASIT